MKRRSDWVNLTGKKINTLTALECLGCGTDGHEIWLCRCDCGRSVTIRKQRLTSHPQRSCGRGCTARLPHRLQTHGLSGTKAYRIWIGLKKHGVPFHKPWRDFLVFLAAVGPAPSDQHELWRVDTALGYVPGNVIWRTRTEQREHRRGGRFLTWRGETLHVSDWEQRTGICHELIWLRVHKMHWSVEKALTTPVGGHKGQVPWNKGKKLVKP